MLRDKVMQGSQGSNDFYTPAYALDPLVSYLDINKTIWEPYPGGGNMVTTLRNHGFTVNNHGCPDLLTPGNNPYDYIITNPPYSIKDKVLRACYDSGKPFALLLPLTALEGKARHELYNKYGIQIILTDTRINFIPPVAKKSSSWFASAWFCHQLNLPTQIVFAKLNKP
jgi:hypothetical protein